MIIFKDGKVIQNGMIYITDVVRLCDFIKPFDKKTTIKLRKEEKISYYHNYPFETYYATRVFNVFLKMVLEDVIYNHIMFKFTPKKVLYLRKEENTKLIKKYCRRYSLIPSMPIYSVVFKMTYKQKFLYKNLRLYGNILDDFIRQHKEANLAEGIKKTKTIKHYLPELQKRFPVYDDKFLLKLIKEVFGALFMPVKIWNTDVIVCDLHHSKNRICSITNPHSSASMLTHYQSLVRYQKKYKDNYFYLLLNDKSQKSIEKGETYVRGLSIYTFQYIKLYQKKYSRQNYKHVYRIMRSNRHSYPRYIQKAYVKVDRLKYLYRRVDERYEPINNTK